MVFENLGTHRHVYVGVILMCIVLWLTTYNKLYLQSTGINTPEEMSDNTLDRQLCTPDQYNNGQWIHNPVTIHPFTQEELSKVAGYYCQKKFAHRCFRREDPNELIRAKQIMDYSWQPDHCDLLELNPKTLATHFTRHPILFLGDSITQLQFESMACLLGQHLPNRRAHGSILNGGNSKIRVEELSGDNINKTAVAYLRSDYLLRLDDFKIIGPHEASGNQLGTGENNPWAHTLSHFDYIVLNTGPHWHPNVFWGPDGSEEDLLISFKKAMMVIYDYLTHHLRHDQIAWIRTTPYGHAKCSLFNEPQDTPLPPTGLEGEYEWHLFAQFDSIWKSIIEAGKDDRIRVFDVSLLSNKRADAHSKPDRDCLHTCIPGPVDEWNRLLYHELKRSA
ncbi:GDSL/SGNH-like acyl-esterase family found in Pmr5 and Cas1p-domain-containing protein [Pilobolus umbonatus]|nr:GDSL/SGNH-like acyl-esterase family found in Pmr5 and Cas1p-domain-containing protein [Pilobolus umbonatus]